MKNILLIQSSPRGSRSYSHRFAADIVAALQASHPGARLIVRDLAQSPLPHIGEEFVSAIGAAAQSRTPEQAEAIARSDTLIDELLAADVIVLAVPMYNFGPPSTLKAWVDHVLRAGRTFAYTAQGPQGQVHGKKAILVVARGGVYSQGPMQALDFQESYLRRVLGFIGIDDVQVVRVEGVAMGEAALDAAIRSATAQTQALAREFA